MWIEGILSDMTAWAPVQTLRKYLVLTSETIPWERRGVTTSIWVLAAVGGGGLLLYRYVVKNFGRWEKEGIPTIPGTFPWGSNVEILTQSKQFSIIIEENYEKFKDEKLYGTYLLGKPVLNINDPDLIRHIMVKDFNHFVDRENSTLQKALEGGKIDALWKRQMTSLSGEERKDVRSTFTPIFTSGKMKGMVQFILDVGDDMSKAIGALADQEKDFELKVREDKNLKSIPSHQRHFI